MTTMKILCLVLCMGIALCCGPPKEILEEEVVFTGEITYVEVVPRWSGLRYIVTFEGSMEFFIDVSYKDFPVVGKKFELIKVEEQGGRIRGYCVREIKEK